MGNVNCAVSDKVAATEPVVVKETMGGAIGSEAVVVGLRSNGFQPLMLEVTFLKILSSSFVSQSTL
jgi:hypothetical protein